jgi:putative transcription factor
LQCEVCGKTLREKPVLVEIEGATMRVCNGCAKFGTPVKPPSKPRPYATMTKPRKNVAPKVAFKQRSRTNELEPIPDLAEVIRKERHKREMTQEDFGKLLFEKASIINKIESGRLVPSNPTLRKIGKKLGVTLLVPVQEIDERHTTSTLEKPIRLGDVVRIKKKKKLN